MAWLTSLPYALRRLNFDTALPLVLTSRPEPYANTVAVWGLSRELP